MGTPSRWGFLLNVLLMCVLAYFDDTKAQSPRLPTQRKISQEGLNDRPIIGIVTHPGDGAGGRFNNSTSASYIAASYVKFAESGGARVIPLIYNEPQEILQEKFKLVNGLIFTGGWCKTGLYYQTVEKLFQLALEENDKGNHFPVFGICLGFELISMILSQDRDILQRFNASRKPSTLHFIGESAKRRSLFKWFTPELLNKLSIERLAMQNHKFGLSPDRLEENFALSSFFEILTTSIDEGDKIYISTVQAYKYPVTGFQWHPEKNAFEWGTSTIPHTADAVQVTQNAANFLVSEAQKSSHVPTLNKVLDHLIYNYVPTYSGEAGKGFDEVYIFA